MDCIYAGSYILGRLVNTVVNLHHEVSFGDSQASGGKFT